MGLRIEREGRKKLTLVSDTKGFNETFNLGGGGGNGKSSSEMKMREDHTERESEKGKRGVYVNKIRIPNNSTGKG